MIQFLDLRISNEATTDTQGTITIPNEPASYLFGDIGLQTANVLPGNAGLVRILLNGYIKVFDFIPIGVGGTITLRVLRDDTTPVLETFWSSPPGFDNETWGFSAVDRPPAVLVSTGQIRYTARISASVGVTSFAFSRNFSGIAVAGNFTGQTAFGV